MKKMIIHLKSGNVIEITRETHGIDVERTYYYSILNGKGITNDAITIPYENIEYVEMVKK